MADEKPSNESCRDGIADGIAERREKYFHDCVALFQRTVETKALPRDEAYSVFLGLIDTCINRLAATAEGESIFASLMEVLEEADFGNMFPYKKFVESKNRIFLSRNISRLTIEGKIIESGEVERKCVEALRVANMYSAKTKDAIRNAPYIEAYRLVKKTATDPSTYADNIESFRLDAVTSVADTIHVTGNTVPFPCVPLAYEPVSDYIRRFNANQETLPEEKRTVINVIIPYLRRDEVDAAFPMHIYKKIFSASVARFIIRGLPCRVFILNAEHYFPEDDVTDSPFTLRECVQYFVAYKIGLVFKTKNNPTLPPYARYLLARFGLLYYTDD